MLTFWQAIAILAVVAAGGAFARIIIAQVRIERARKLRERLDYHRPKPKFLTDYSSWNGTCNVNRNRSERWD